MAEAEKFSKFAHRDEIVGTSLAKHAELLEAMIEAHKDIIPPEAINMFYKNYGTLAYAFSGKANELVPVQNRFTDEERKQFHDTLDKCGFKVTKVLDSIESLKEPQYNRNDYTAGNDDGIISILKFSKTPVWEVFDKGYYKNDYCVVLGSPNGTGKPRCYSTMTRCNTMSELCYHVEQILKG